MPHHPAAATGVKFQHTAARRRLLQINVVFALRERFQHTAARRRLPPACSLRDAPHAVSTHSRPKAAADAGFQALPYFAFQHTAARRRLRVPFPCVIAHRSSFNTQPPEGGCPHRRIHRHRPRSFNTQPPEGGCRAAGCLVRDGGVSTHSRPKAAALICSGWGLARIVSTHSRPKAAAPCLKTL